MKKIIIIATALVFTTGILVSQTKVNTVQTVSVTPVPTTVSSSMKDLASGD